MRQFSTWFCFAASVSFGLSFATAASARTIYECQINQHDSNRGWIPEVVVVAYEPGAAEMQVSDPFILHVHGKPIAVNVKKDNDARLSLSWDLVLESASQNKFRINFDFSIFKADKRAKIVASPNGGYRPWSSEGKCKILKG